MSKTQPPTLGFGVVGAGWMGHVHARSVARLRHHYPDAAYRVRLVGVADSLRASRDAFTSQHADVL